MKPLHWSKLPQHHISNTIWDNQINEDEIRKKLDIKDFEEMFRVKTIGVSKLFFFSSFFFPSSKNKNQK